MRNGLKGFVRRALRVPGERHAASIQTSFSLDSVG